MYTIIDKLTKECTVEDADLNYLKQLLKSNLYEGGTIYDTYKHKFELVDYETKELLSTGTYSDMWNKSENYIQMTVIRIIL